MSDDGGGDDFGLGEFFGAYIFARLAYRHGVPLVVNLARAFVLLCIIPILLPLALHRVLHEALRVRPQQPLVEPPLPALPTDPPAAATGDWRKDQETLRRLIAEGKIK